MRKYAGEKQVAGPAARRRRRLIACIGGVFLVASGLTACSAASGDGDTLTLRFASGFPEGNAISEGHEWWMSEVEERSDGRIAFDRNYGGSLYGALDITSALQSSALDVGVYSSQYSPAESPLGTITDLPFMTDDPIASAYALHELSQRSDAYRAEFEDLGLHPAVFGAIDAGGSFTNEPVTSLDDFDGLTIRSIGAQGKAMEALGANPIFMAADELYQSLERGVIDGIAPFAIDTTPSLSTYEVAPHATHLGMGVYVNVALGFSDTAWTQIPDDVKEVMAEVTADYYAGEAERILVEQYEAACDLYVDLDSTFTIIADDEIAPWRDEVAGVLLDEWKDFTAANGVAAGDAEAFFDDYVATVAEFEGDSDYQSGILACAARING